MVIKYFLKMILVSVLVMTSLLAQAEDGLIKLKKNPFSKPDIKLQKSLPQVKVMNRQPVRETIINLEATMVSVNGSMVIVNGELIAVGDKIENLKLIEVREGEAVFGRDRKTRVYKVGVTELN